MASLPAADGRAWPNNAWLNEDGSVTPVEHHEDDGGYTSAIHQSRVRIVSYANKELSADASYSGQFTPKQIEAVRQIYAQTKASTLFVGGYTRSIPHEVHPREIEQILSKFNPRQ